jgi:hypothetical protein
MATLTKAEMRAARGGGSDPAFQALWLLRLGFTVAPILFGLDKFAHWLVDWDKYLAPEFTDLFSAQAQTLMYLVGAIEIVAGLVVLARPRFGGYLVAAWLGGIITNLLLIGDYYDIALRDFGLLLAALALARLAAGFPASQSPSLSERFPSVHRPRWPQGHRHDDPHSSLVAASAPERKEIA